MARGCRGDFTFPAGRAHTNPRQVAPFLCLPVHAPKGYDLPQADPIPALRGAARAALERRFFIWASAATHAQCSIDYYSAEFRRMALDIPQWAMALVKESVRIGDTLFLKTHAHSMYPEYFEGIKRPVAPHQHPTVQTLLGAIFDAAGDASVDAQCRSASEVFDLIVGDADGGVRPVAPSFRAAAAKPPTATLNDICLRVAARQASALGDAQSGAGVYYRSLIDAGTLIQDYEAALVESLLPILGPRQSIADVGTGFGTTGILLAAEGFTVTGVEPDARRSATAQAVVDEIRRLHSTMRFDLSIMTEKFPDGIFLKRPAPFHVLIFTDCVTGLKDSDFGPIVAALKAYPMTILDPDRFFRRRVAGSRWALAEMLSGAGLAPPETQLAFGDRVFWRLRPSS
jgi:hypothetical protein